MLTFHSYQIQSEHQNRKQQQAAMSHCELQPAITSPSLACRLWQSLYLKQVQEVQEALPQQANSLPTFHLEIHIDTNSPSLQQEQYDVKKKQIAYNS